MFTVKQHMGKVSQVLKDKRNSNSLMDYYLRRECQRDEHPRPLSVNSDAVLWADALLGKSTVAELFS